MKLSRIYSDDERFTPVNFRPGLNIVLARIEDPENIAKDTHNLGKTTLASVIDFCLLRGVDARYFMVKHADRFRDFVFFLEVETNKHGFVTVRRSAATPSKISLLKHDVGGQDFRTAGDWSHVDLAFDRAKSMLDSLLELSAVADWDFRDAVGYSLRGQKDYADVFQLNKFKGKHADWKPFLAHILGLDGQLVRNKYKLDADIESHKADQDHMKTQLAGLGDSPDRLEGIILSKQAEIDQLDEQVGNYDFKISDQDINQDLVDRIEAQISGLNEQRYAVRMSLARIEESLKDKIQFDLAKVSAIYKEAEIVLPDQLKRNFDELVEFNKSLTVEREEYLKEDHAEQEKELTSIDAQLSDLNAERVDALSSLRELETFEKYKKLNKRLVAMKADLEALTRQREAIRKLQAASKAIRDANTKIESLAEEMQANIDDPKTRYKDIRLFFSDIIHDTLGRKANLYTQINTQNNIEFAAEILDEKGVQTSQDEGHTYRKLLCIAFDMAVLRAYSAEDYIRFVYHDGILESLDDRKKLNLIEVLRSYSQYGLQQIITSIESDLPVRATGERFSFDEDEVVCELHDKGEDGRLFKMEEW